MPTGKIIFIIFSSISALVIFYYIAAAQDWIKRTPVTIAIEKRMEWLGRVFATLASKQYVAPESTIYRCRHCQFEDQVNSPFCPKCGLNDNGQPESEALSYSCTFCRKISKGKHKYCPECGRNYKGNIRW